MSRYKLESVARKPPVRPVAAAKATQAEERGRADCSGRKGNARADFWRGFVPSPRVLMGRASEPG